MNIKGIVTDSRGQGPIAGAKVVLAIGDRDFATTATNNLGRFEHREDQNFPGQVLTCTVEKQKFQTAVVRRPLDSDIVNLTIIMQAEKPAAPPPPPTPPTWEPDQKDKSVSGGGTGSTTSTWNDGLVEALKEHWAKIFAVIALLILIGVGVSTCSRPTIKTFAASSMNVKRGEKVKLTWETAKASLVTLNGAKVGPSGSMEVIPTETRPYELRTKNDYGGNSKYIVITVTAAPPPTVKFRVEPQQVEKKETAVLHWETTGATQVKLNNIKVALSGYQAVTPEATQKYTLVAENEDGEKSESLTLNVTPADTTTHSDFKLSFKATRNPVPRGEDTTLSWDAGIVKDVELKQGDQPPQKVTPKGEMKVTPSGTTTYVLTGYPPTGEPISKRVNIRVAPVTPVLPSAGKPDGDGGGSPPGDGKPRITFDAQSQGQGTRLTWNVENAKEVKFKADGESEKSVPLSGSMQVTPSSSTTYTISASSATGTTVKKTVSVRVTSGSDGLTTNGVEEAEVVRVNGFTYILRIRGKEYTVTADTHTNKDSNISSGTSVTVRVEKNRLLEIKK